MRRFEPDIPVCDTMLLKVLEAGWKIVFRGNGDFGESEKGQKSQWKNEKTLGNDNWGIQRTHILPNLAYPLPAMQTNILLAATNIEFGIWPLAD